MRKSTAICKLHTPPATHGCQRRLLLLEDVEYEAWQTSDGTYVAGQGLPNRTGSGGPLPHGACQLALFDFSPFILNVIIKLKAHVGFVNETKSIPPSFEKPR